MYLSRLILNPRSRRVRSELARPYELHRTLMRSFAQGLEAGDERVLYRLDEEPRTARLTLIVQSLGEPNWAWLAEPGAHDYLLPTAEDNPASKRFDPRLPAGQVLAFRLRANPTKKVSETKNLSEGDRETHRRLGLFGEEAQMEWLRRKAAAGGFELVGARTRQEGFQDAVDMRHTEGQRRLRFLAVTFDGLLRVKEPAAFLLTLERGIGSGKGMGFGLLSLAPPVVRRDA